MKNRKIVSLLLVGALMAGMFTVTGCGGSSDGKSSAKGGKTELEQFSVDYNLAFASYLLVLIPVLLVYLFCQKWIMNGVVAGAVK